MDRRSTRRKRPEVIAAGRVIYLDDPDGNVVEQTERATLWEGNPATEVYGAYLQKGSRGE